MVLAIGGGWVGGFLLGGGLVGDYCRCSNPKPSIFKGHATSS
jgi:hypothetical protein